ncbi:MAG: hypothetical protein P8X50_09935 [Maritimibacter sp.]
MDENDAPVYPATTALPSSGSAEYSGAVVMAAATSVDAPTADLLMADSTLSASFAAGGATIDGDMTNWHGIQGITAANSEDYAASPETMIDDLNLGVGSGAVSISGTMTGAHDALTVDGDVTLNGTSYGVNGPVETQFYGSNGEYLVFDGGLDTAAEYTPTFTIDDQEGVGFILGIYGQ